MKENLPFSWALIVLPLAFVALWCWWVHLMLNKPQQWLELFFNKPYRWFGLQISIVDEAKFRRLARLYLYIPIIVSVIGLLVATIALLNR